MKQHAFIRLKIENLWALTVLVGVFVFVNTHPIRPNDFWFHLAYGRILAQTGHIPTVDSFSFTMAGQPYLSAYNYWLAQLLMYSLFQVGGAEWSILVSALLVTFAYALILMLNLRQSRNWRLAAAGALFAAMAGITNWNLRPQLLVYPLTALSILGMDAFRRGRKRLAWGGLLFAVMVLWVNIHATFFIPLLLATFWLAETGFHALRRHEPAAILPPLGLLTILLTGTLINPQGYKVYLYMVQMSRSTVVQDYIYEWQPASLHTTEGMIFFALLVVFLFVLGIVRPPISISRGLSFLFFAVLAWKYGRAVVWFGLTQAPLLVYALQTGLKRWYPRANPPGREISVLNTAFALILILLTLASVPWLRGYWPLTVEKQDIYASETPVDAAAFMLNRGLPDRVFADIGFSSYLIWACEAQCHVFSDPRFDLYPPKIWSDYVQISAGQKNWEAKLRAYDVQVLLLSLKTQHALIQSAKRSSEWVQIYEDKVAVLFVRRE